MFFIVYESEKVPGNMNLQYFGDLYPTWSFLSMSELSKGYWMMLMKSDFKTSATRY